MKVLLAVNPISGGVNKEPFMRFAEDLLTSYGIDYRVFRTTGKDDERELKKAVSDYGPTRVASLGGDGVAACRKYFCDTGGRQSFICHAKCCA